MQLKTYAIKGILIEVLNLNSTLDGKPMKETVDPAFKLVFEEDNEKIRSILNEVAQDASDMKVCKNYFYGDTYFS